jgi:hypothetical protein
MKINVGQNDRVFRMILGAVLLVLPFIVSFNIPYIKSGLVIVGLILLITAVTRFCPAYRIFGWRTSKR